jgi:hypothetical protein
MKSQYLCFWQKITFLFDIIYLFGLIAPNKSSLYLHSLRRKKAKRKIGISILRRRQKFFSMKRIDLTTNVSLSLKGLKFDNLDYLIYFRKM